MKCKIDNDLLQKYLDNDLEKIEKIILDEHIKTCAHCKKELTELKLLMFEINSLIEESINYPKELDYLTDSIIEQADKDNISEGLSISTPMIFLKFIPGREFVSNNAKKSFKLLNKVSIATLNYGFKKIRKRII
jgi:hypothetical protein